MNPFAQMTTSQWTCFHEKLALVEQRNPFQKPRFPDADLWKSCAGFTEFSKLFPLTSKEELEKDRLVNPPYGTNFTYAVEQYNRFSQTSGSLGKPMSWLDTEEDWKWMLGNWDRVLEGAGVERGSICFFAFSFGPFLGFWTAYESAQNRGCVCIPGGGQSTETRLSMILDHGVEFLFCTPTYACRLVDTANQKNISLNRNRLQKIIVAGECGGSNPYTRKMLDQAWGKSSIVCDHYGMTEVGPVAYEINERGRGMHIMLSSYYPEVIDPQSTNPVEEGQIGELVLTPLGRWGTPLLRYRTGDLVRAYKGSDPQGLPTFFLEGGILGRVDDMVVVRGVNIYPSAVDSTVREFLKIHEYQVVVEQSRAMSEMLVRAECEPSIGKLLEEKLREVFSLRVPVECVSVGSLPRFEMKAKRWIYKS